MTPGSHLGTVDPNTFDWVQILGSEVRNRGTILFRLQEFERTRERSRAKEEQERVLDSSESRRMTIGRMHAGV